MTDEQRDTRVTFEVGVLAPTGVVTQFSAVVGPQSTTMVFLAAPDVLRASRNTPMLRSV